MRDRFLSMASVLRIIGADGGVIDGQGLQGFETRFRERLDQFLGNLIARFGEDFTGFLINDIFGDVLIDQIGIADQLLLEAVILEFRRGA